VNPIERLRDELAGRFPDADVEIDAPADAAGTWHLDVRPGGDIPWIVVEWKADRGFGVSTPGPDDYGLKPDELYSNAKAVYDRVVQLVLSGGRTTPPAVVQLAELRMHRGFSQPELAERAGMKQANLSRIENRDDVKLSTLARIVAAMGGASAIVVKFPDGQSFEITIGRDEARAKTRKPAAPARGFRPPSPAPTKPQVATTTSNFQAKSAETGAATGAKTARGTAQIAENPVTSIAPSAREAKIGASAKASHRKGGK